jgi:hypothetical protein
LHATSYIITYRATDDPARRANLDAVLAWLKLQTLADVIVVEQDVAPTLGDLVSFTGLRSLFAYNPGPFNNLGWGGEDEAMDIKVERSGARGAMVKGSPGFHLAHRRASGAIAANAHYRNNLALLQQLRATPNDALRRMCEVTAQLAGNPDMHRRIEKLA